MFFYIFLPLKQFVSALFQEEAKCFLLPYITKHYTVRWECAAVVHLCSWSKYEPEHLALGANVIFLG